MKSILLALSVVFSLSAFAQNADTTYTFFWNGYWYYNARNYTTVYDNNCRTTSDISQAYDTTTKQWTDNIKDLYTYTAAGSINTEIIQEWDVATSQFINSAQIIYTYNASNKVLTVFQQSWVNNAWQNSLLTTYTYDANGNETTYLFQDWYNNNWQNSVLITYSNFNSNGNPTSSLLQVGILNSSGWTDYSRSTYTYVAANEVQTELKQQLVSNVWVNYQLISSTWDVNNHLTKQLTQDYSGNDLVNNYQTIQTYNSYGKIDSILNQSWNSGIGVWDNEDLGTYVYKTACALPLTLLNFSAVNNDNIVSLNWKTANEINTSHFNVQRSINATDFNTIQTVTANAGSITKTYNATDNIAKISLSKLYYRLQMVDKDGKYTFSKVVPVAFNNNIQISVWPNPAKDYLTVTQHNAGLVKTEIKIIDLSGRTVLQKLITNSAAQKINISALPDGVYMINIKTDANKTVTQKLVISK